MSDKWPQDKWEEEECHKFHTDWHDLQNEIHDLEDRI